MSKITKLNKQRTIFKIMNYRFIFSLKSKLKIILNAWLISDLLIHAICNESQFKHIYIYIYIQTKINN